MLSTERSNFILMMNVTMGLTNRFPLTDDETISWWNSLVSYDINTVRFALDAWVDSSNKPPAPYDIKQLCKPKPDFYQKLTSPNSRERNKEYSEEVVSYVSKNLKPKTDFHAWFKRILRNPKNFPDDSVKEARRVSKEFGYDLESTA